MNRQLKHLYDTPVPGQPFPAPPPRPQPPKKFLIDHTLIMAPSKSLSKLVANIGPPKVSWDKLSPTANPGRTIKLTFPLIAGSKFINWVQKPSTDNEDNNDGSDEGADPPQFTQVVTPVSGYSMSFEASIGRADIQDVEERKESSDL